MAINKGGSFDPPFVYAALAWNRPLTLFRTAVQKSCTVVTAVRANFTPMRVDIFVPFGSLLPSSTAAITSLCLYTTHPARPAPARKERQTVRPFFHFFRPSFNLEDTLFGDGAREDNREVCKRRQALANSTLKGFDVLILSRNTGKNNILCFTPFEKHGLCFCLADSSAFCYNPAQEGKPEQNKEEPR